MNDPDKPPPMNVAVVLHTGGKSSAFNPAASDVIDQLLRGGQ